MVREVFPVKRRRGGVLGWVGEGLLRCWMDGTATQEIEERGFYVPWKFEDSNLRMARLFWERRV